MNYRCMFCLTEYKIDGTIPSPSCCRPCYEALGKPETLNEAVDKLFTVKYFDRIINRRARSASAH